jgi:hypothetical protein
MMVEGQFALELHVAGQLSSAAVAAMTGNCCRQSEDRCTADANMLRADAGCDAGCRCG